MPVGKHRTQPHEKPSTRGRGKNRALGSALARLPARVGLYLWQGEIMSETIEKDWVAEIGRPAYGSIAEMVAALECDYDRLGELQDERDTWVTNDGGDEDEQNRTAAEWVKEFPDEAEELADLETAAGESKDRDEANERIQEDALSVRVFGERVDGEWEADKFELLLSTGGPAVRIMGELDQHCEPTRAWLEVQDWFKPWTQYFPADQDTLLTYCRCFYFGE